MTIHVCAEPEREISRRDAGVRWCFRCRRRVWFVRRVLAPVDPDSWYGPRLQIECEHGHIDGDVFPGLVREGLDG